jgi:hypothetical protein
MTCIPSYIVVLQYLKLHIVSSVKQKYTVEFNGMLTFATDIRSKEQCFCETLMIVYIYCYKPECFQARYQKIQT